MSMKKKISEHIEEVMATIFGSIAVIPQAVYWIKAIEVSMDVCPFNSEIMWCSGGPGTFFPWPHEPGMLQVFTPMEGLDQFIYIVIVSGFFILIMLAITFASTHFGIIVGRHFKNKLKISNLTDPNPE